MRSGIDKLEADAGEFQRKSTGITEVAVKTCHTSVNWSSRRQEFTADYGSSRQNLPYFRKLEQPGDKNSQRITEVAVKTCYTSVN